MTRVTETKSQFPTLKKAHKITKLKLWIFKLMMASANNHITITHTQATGMVSFS